jgi:Uma2 family endonuclease
MSTMPAAALMTADEFLELPLPRPWTQLVAGEVVVYQPLPKHQIVCTRLLVTLVNWSAAQAGRGVAILPLDIRADDRNVYAPDILWYAEGRAPGIDAGRPSPMPNIAVEVRSPSTWRYDIGVKLPVYEERGLHELWLVDTRADTVLVFSRSGPDSATFDVTLELERDEQLTSPQLPGFALALDELFVELS